MIEYGPLRFGKDGFATTARSTPPCSMRRSSRSNWSPPKFHSKTVLMSLLCCAKIPFSFKVDRYHGQPANNRLTFIDALLPEREPHVIVGLETSAEMNLVQIETNEFFRRVSTGCTGGR